jgi:hypothetical protein
MSVTGGDDPKYGRPDPYEDLLAEGFGQDAVSRPIPSGATAILKTLVEKEASWRRRLGDKGYERALANWHAMWGEGTR